VLTGGTDNTNSQSDVNLALGQITGIGSSPISPGSPIPRFDPNIVGQYGWIHNTTPQANEGSFGVPRWLRGPRFSIPDMCKVSAPARSLQSRFNNTRHSLNAPNIDYNPYTAGSVGLTVTQPLLQGFGTATNKRFIRIARNNEKIADLTFQQQLVRRFLR